MDGNPDFWLRKRALEPYNNGFWIVFDAAFALSEEVEWSEQSESAEVFRSVFRELGVAEVPVLQFSCHKVSEMLLMVSCVKMNKKEKLLY